MKLTGAAILVSRGMKVLQAAPAAYPYRSARFILDTTHGIGLEKFLQRLAEAVDWCAPRASVDDPKQRHPCKSRRVYLVDWRKKD